MNLEELASQIVGDGKQPNLYFVSFVQFEGMKMDDSWGVIAVFKDPDMAVEFARSLENTRAVLVEDRLQGEFWTNRKYARMQKMVGWAPGED